MTSPVPAGWSKDLLSAYLDGCRRNQHSTFVNKRAAAEPVIAVDALFALLFDGWINPRPFIPISFATRAHSAYRAACGSVLAGQVYEASALLRLCLEHGAYGFFIDDDQERWERWMRRADSKATRRKVRDEFGIGAVKRHIAAAAPKLADQFTTLYERVIDYGAHPNERGFSANAAMRQVNGNTLVETIYLQVDGMVLDAALRTCAQVGLWVLHILQLIYTTRFELLGLRQELERIRRPF